MWATPRRRPSSEPQAGASCPRRSRVGDPSSPPATRSSELGRRAPDGAAWRCTTLRHKTHGTPLGSAGGTEATVAYAWHPWFGRSVVIHDLMVRSSGVFARCRLDGAASGALQEIPRWMLDPGACSPMRAMAVPVVSLPALATLAALLSEVLTCAAAALSDKAGVASRDHQYGDRDAASSFLASAAEATARPLCGKPTTDAGVERPSGSGTTDVDGTDDPPAARPRRRRQVRAEERSR